MSWASRGVWLAAAVVAVVCIAGRSAFAAAWLWPVGSSVSLQYGAAWVDAGGRRCTHGGVDIAATGGDSVRACVGGRVAFSGEVPSAAGGRVCAVTIETPDGLRVSVTPLAFASVASGDALAAGATIGTLAAAGDGSSPDAHLHLSVRRGETSLDPERFLSGAPVIHAPAIAAPTPDAGGAGGSAGAPSAAGPVPLPTRAGVVAPWAESIPVASVARVADAARVPAASVPGRITAPLSRMDGRAIHELPSGSVRLPRVAFRVPEMAPLPVRTLAVRLCLALAAAAAMWGCAARARALPAENAAESRR